MWLAVGQHQCNDALTMSVSTTKFTYIKNDKGLCVCPTCGETKARQNTMFYHMKKHTGEFNHACTLCDAKFIQKSGLVQHMTQAHPTGAEPSWACPCCDHTSKMKANLLIHIGRKHGEGWIPAVAGACTCGGCKKGFGSATAYYYHAVQCFGSAAPEAVKLAIDGLLA